MVKVQFIVLNKDTKQILYREENEIENQELSSVQYQEIVEKTKAIAKSHNNAYWNIKITSA